MPKLPEREQVSVVRMVENAWTTFSMRMVSIGALYVMWGSLTTPEDLLARYLVAKGESEQLNSTAHSEEQRERLDGVQRLAREAVQYRDWARRDNGQPLLREALVGYCIAFESALKAVATAFALNSTTRGSLENMFCRPSDIAAATRATEGAWSSHRGPERAKAFFESSIFQKNPDPRRWALSDPSSMQGSRFRVSPKQHWMIAGEAALLRNAIVHADGRVRQRVDVWDEAFYPGDEIRLTPTTLRAVQTAVNGILYPLSPDAL